MLEGKLADEEFSRLLVSPDLTESHGAGPVPVGLHDSSCGRSRLARSLGGQLLPWGLTSSPFTGIQYEKENLAHKPFFLANNVLMVLGV